MHLFIKEGYFITEKKTRNKYFLQIQSMNSYNSHDFLSLNRQNGVIWTVLWIQASFRKSLIHIQTFKKQTSFVSIAFEFFLLLDSTNSSW